MEFKSLDTEKDNHEFINALYKCFSKKNNINFDCSINPFNFAIFDRPYSISDITSAPVFAVNVLPIYYKTKNNTAAGADLPFTYNDFNYSVNPLAFNKIKWHEDRGIGKAIFIHDFEN